MILKRTTPTCRLDAAVNERRVEEPRRHVLQFVRLERQQRRPEGEPAEPPAGAAHVDPVGLLVARAVSSAPAEPERGGRQVRRGEGRDGEGESDEGEAGRKTAVRRGSDGKGRGRGVILFYFLNILFIQIK